MELNLKPALAIYWSTVIEPLLVWIMDKDIPVYLLSESQNLVDKEAVMLAVRVVDLFEFLGVQHIVPGMPDDSPMVRVGYLMRFQGPSNEEKSVYFQTLQIIEGRLRQESDGLVFKTLARLELESFEPKNKIAGYYDEIPF